MFSIVTVSNHINVSVELTLTNTRYVHNTFCRAMMQILEYTFLHIAFLNWITQTWNACWEQLHTSLISLCSQQQLRRCQSELNRQVKQSSSVIQEKVPFNDTSEYLVLFENISILVSDTITTRYPGVSTVTLHTTVTLRRRNQLNCVCKVNKSSLRGLKFCSSLHASFFFLLHLCRI